VDEYGTLRILICESHDRKYYFRLALTHTTPCVDPTIEDSYRKQVTISGLLLPEDEAAKLAKEKKKAESANGGFFSSISSWFSKKGSSKMTTASGSSLWNGFFAQAGFDEATTEKFSRLFVEVRFPAVSNSFLRRPYH
jgi:hypothetical protein